MPSSKEKPEAQESALVAAVKAAAGSTVNVTDDGNRLRVTASAAAWDGLWLKLATVKPLGALHWDGCEQDAGTLTSIWVR
jgi:hypothetical protein